MNDNEYFLDLCERGKNYPDIGEELANCFNFFEKEWTSGNMKYYEGSISSSVMRSLDHPRFEEFNKIITEVEGMYNARLWHAEKELRKQNQKVS